MAEFTPTLNIITGKWRHRCPVCEIEFEGRKNRRYCSDHCKKLQNNNRLIPYEEFLQSQYMKLQRNIAVIRKMISTGQREITFAELKAMGFEMNAACPLYEHNPYGALRRYDDWVLMVNPVDKIVELVSYEKIASEEDEKHDSDELA